MAKYFLLDDLDKIEIYRHKGAQSQIAYAIQLCTVRFLGTFVSDVNSIPATVINYVSKQIGITKKFYEQQTALDSYSRNTQYT